MRVRPCGERIDRERRRARQCVQHEQLSTADTQLGLCRTREFAQRADDAPEVVENRRGFRVGARCTSYGHPYDLRLCPMVVHTNCAPGASGSKRPTLDSLRAKSHINCHATVNANRRTGTKLLHQRCAARSGTRTSARRKARRLLRRSGMRMLAQRESSADGIEAHSAGATPATSRLTHARGDRSSQRRRRGKEALQGALCGVPWAKRQR